MARTERWSRLLKFLVLVGLGSALVYHFVKPSPSSTSNLKPVPKEVYELISPSTYQHVLNQDGLCRRRKPFLVLMIPVRLEDRESREAIRNTWGQEDLVPHVDVARLFFIGKPKDEKPKPQEELEKESRDYGDIIQMNFVDSYLNLTIKTMMMMDWLATYCPSAQYAMKTDADVFLNVPYLVDYLQNRASKKDFITGSVINDGRPRRSKNSKWYLSEELYEENTFPPYVSGAGYVFSVDLARRISWASRYVRPIPMEDVYVGMCLHVLGVRPVFSWTLFPFRNLFEIQHLNYERCTFAKRIIVISFKPRELLEIWQDFYKASFLC